jgi:hypothetical protein
MWMLADLESVKAQFERWRIEARQQFVSTHPRAADVLAQLWAAYCVFDRFLGDRHLVDEDKRRERCQLVWHALTEDHPDHTVETDPADAFLTQLGSAISSKVAYLAGPKGGQPQGFEAACGWVEDSRSYGGITWRAPANSRQVGWVSASNLYLEPDAAYLAARKMGTAVMVSRRMIGRLLRDSGKLLGWDQARGVVTIRRVLEGTSKEVLWLSRDALGIGVQPVKPAPKKAPQGSPGAAASRQRPDPTVP